MQNHRIQMEILKVLLFNPSSRFTDLQPKGLSSDHLNYHLKNLIDSGFVAKQEGRYILTPKGKDHANKMDTDSMIMEKQPKPGVIVIVETEIEGVKKILVQTRLKEPYYGYLGFISGKVRFGEGVYETARRELEEEVGISADLNLEFIAQERTSSKEGIQLEDKIYFVFRGINPVGEIIDAEGCKNQWMTVGQLKDSENIIHDALDLYGWLDKRDKDFLQIEYTVDGF